MDILSVIRRWRFRQKMPIREIKRRSGLSRADSDDAGHLFRSDPGRAKPDRDCLTALGFGIGQAASALVWCRMDSPVISIRWALWFGRRCRRAGAAGADASVIVSGPGASRRRLPKPRCSVADRVICPSCDN